MYGMPQCSRVPALALDIITITDRFWGTYMSMAVYKTVWKALNSESAVRLTVNISRQLTVAIYSLICHWNQLCSNRIAWCLSLSVKTGNSIWQWSLLLNGFNTFTLHIASGSLLNIRSNKLSPLIGDWTTYEKPRTITKFRSASWFPSQGAFKVCQSMLLQLKSPANIQWYVTFERAFIHSNIRGMWFEFSAL